MTSIALPVPPVGSQEGVRRYFDQRASFVDLPVASIALPPAAVRGVREIRVRWHFDRRACRVDFTVASIALPSTSIALHVGVERRCGGITLCRGNARQEGDGQEENQQLF
jgi:hypothetical protein